MKRPRNRRAVGFVLAVVLVLGGLAAKADALGGPYNSCFVGTVCVLPNGSVWAYDFAASENYPNVVPCTSYDPTCNSYANVGAMRNRMSGTQRRFMAINITFYTATCRELVYDSRAWVSVSYSANEESVSPTHYAFCNFV